MGNWEWGPYQSPITTYQTYLSGIVGKIPTLARFALLVLIFTGLAAAWQSPTVSAQSSGITNPESGDIISGQVPITGTAVHPDFLRYELAVRRQTGENADWLVFADGVNQVTAGTLAVWDTAAGRDSGNPVFPDGRYQLRLRVVKTDYNYDEYFVTDLILSNEGPTPTATPDETTAATTATAVPGPNQNSGSTLNPATPIPSLTPFPTPTPPATPVPPASGPQANTQGSEPDSGLAAQLENANTGRIGQAFWLGVKISISIFALLALYLVLRTIFRWLWRVAWAKKVRGD